VILGDNIAILQLSSPFNLTKYVQPAYWSRAQLQAVDRNDWRLPEQADETRHMRVAEMGQIALQSTLVPNRNNKSTLIVTSLCRQAHHVYMISLLRDITIT
jgi:hypothetical protein